MQEHANRKLEILEKTLELEKEKLENEEIEARNKAILAEFETRYDITVSRRKVVNMRS